MDRHAPEMAVTAPLRVAYLLEQAWHSVPGGTAVAAVRTAEALAARDDVELVGLTARHTGSETDVGIARVPSTIEVVASRLPRPLLYEAWHRLRLPLVDRITGFPDVVHASGGAVPPSRRPLVATVHDLAWRRHPELATPRGRRVFEAWLADARRAQVVLCPSEATRRDLLEADFAEHQIRVVPLGAESRTVAPAQVNEVLRRYHLDRPFVLWVGTVEPRKNLNALVESMVLVPELNEVPLVLVGPNGWQTNIQRITAPLGDRVVIVGPVNEAERDAWLKAATVFCLPSLYEGFGLPILEAMAQGTPVVTSSGTATEEVVGTAGLVVNPEDPGAIGEALSAVLFDGRIAERLARKGQERVSLFTWGAAAERTVAAYQEALARWGG